MVARFFKGRVENGVLKGAHCHLPPVVKSALRQRVAGGGMIRAQARNRKAGQRPPATQDWDGDGIGGVWSAGDGGLPGDSEALSACGAGR